MRSGFPGPVNIGSDEMVTINQLVAMVMDIAGKRLTIHHVSGPLGVRGRNSDNRLIKAKLGWAPSQPLRAGLEETYSWSNRKLRGIQREATARAPIRRRPWQALESKRLSPSLPQGWAFSPLLVCAASAVPVRSKLQLLAGENPFL